MTRPQQEATYDLFNAECNWLIAYGWSKNSVGTRFTHPSAPDTRPDYSLRDAVAMTRSDLLRYGSAIRSVG